MRAALVLSGAVALALAACAGPGPTYGARSGTAIPSYQHAPATSGAEQQEASLTAPTQPGGRARKITLETLPGMTGSALTAALGAPQYRRRDGTAEIWQYRGGACTLDVFLYADGNDLRVRYVDARGKDEVQAKDPSAARACATALIESRAPTS